MGAGESKLESRMDQAKSVNFLINGKTYTVNPEENPKLGPKSVLVDYIRDEAGLKGTKYMCREGGCGACVVTVKTKDPVTGEDQYRAVNSCLTPVFSCDGWDISTIEKLGNRKDGYHQIQTRLANFGGTQCGYCTPGMVMNMYSVVQSKKNLSAKEIEDQFDGNICRCTGYRPILDAFKTLAPDVPAHLRQKCLDIEECNKVKCELNLPKEETVQASPKIHLHLRNGEQWIKPDSLSTLFEASQRLKTEGMTYRLVGGNTASGIYKNDGPFSVYIDISGVSELKKMVIAKTGVILGGGLTLATVIERLKEAAKLEGFEYALDISNHLSRVANVPVRNVATIAGNLMIKNTHNEFPSDPFILFGTVGAKLNIATAPTLTTKYSVEEFSKLDMKNKLILSIELPPLPVSEGYRFRSFKITRRYQNAHAYVNAGFLFKIDPSNFTVKEKPTILYGGIHPTFAHADGTEEYFNGKSLNDSTVLQGGLGALESEINPVNNPPDGSPDYRKSLTQSLLYKAILGILGDKAKANLQSGGKNIEHIQTFGKQTYDTDEADWPIGQPVMKLEAPIQCSGEAEYVNDIRQQHGELAGAFVLTTVANANIKSIDATDALKIPGVKKFIQAKDIPGTNNYMVFNPIPEEIFLSDKVTAAGQSVGLILAETREIALAAAKVVKVEYTNVKKPILKIQDAMALAEKEGKMTEVIFPPLEVPSLLKGEPKHTIKGEMNIGSQFHFQMENQVTLCVPKDDGLDIFPATQWIDHVQATVASALKIPNNAINIQVRRLGGGYGSKISRATHVSAACAIAAHLTNKPVRVVLDLETNMKMLGKRLPFYAKYEVGFEDNGKISTLSCKIICDTGSVPNEVTSFLAMLCMQSGYESTGWKVAPGKVSTNTVSNTYCRSPGSTQGFAVIETIMEHIAATLKKDPLEVRLVNFIKDGDKLLGDPAIVLADPSSEDYQELLKNPQDKFQGENYILRMVDELKISGELEERKKFIATFNQQNRWRKRGLGIVPMRYPVHYFSFAFPAYVAILQADASVVVSHGGIEMGQGINTKVAQVVAKTLNVPFDRVRVKASNNLVNPNSMTSGGAITSEVVCHAAMQSCNTLIARMAPVKEKMKNPTWEGLITACHSQGIDLRAHHFPSAKDDIKSYSVWGLNAIETEVDVLTGEFKIVRCDLIEDAGKSLSQEVDVGQIEGALVMGLGLWTSEKLQYNETTGELLTHNTWEYKVPLAKDIPEDLRITLLKNAPNPYGVLRSKATGEPPLCMSVGILFALRNAIDSARQDAGNSDYYQMDGPVTPEDVLKLTLSTKDKFTL